MARQIEPSGGTPESVAEATAVEQENLAITPDIIAGTDASATVLQPTQVGSMSGDELLVHLGQELGRSEAFAVSEQLSRVGRIAAYKRVKDSGLYKRSFRTWEDCCKKLFRRPRSSVDTEIHALERFGPDLLGTLIEGSFGRAALRLLKSVPEDQFRVEAGDVIIRDRRIPMNVDHKEELAEVFQDFVAELRDTREQLRVGAEQFQELEVRQGQQVSELKRRLQKLEKAPSSDSTLGIHPLARAGTEVFFSFKMLVEDIEAEQPDRAMVLRLFRQFSPLMSKLAQYGGNYTAPDDLDGDSRDNDEEVGGGSL